jgi:hypothetical protein
MVFKDFASEFYSKLYVKYMHIVELSTMLQSEIQLYFEGI